MKMTNKYTKTSDDGITRCWWGDKPEDYRRYHDKEWGRPTKDEFKLFEKICLEGFQSGLSWHIILRKRENFRKAFVGFDFNKIATFNGDKVEELLKNEGIVRHRQKIEATINNAKRALELVEEYGSLAKYIWSWEPKLREPHAGKGEYDFPIPSITKTSQLLSKDLKKRGWKFFGPTTAYAFMQAMGLVNDHMKECYCYKEVEDLKRKFKVP